MNYNQLWQAALGQLELKVSQGNFLTWFRDTKIKECKSGKITIETPSAFAHEWLSRKYRDPILEVLQDLDKEIKDVGFNICSNTKTYQPIKKSSHILMQKTRKKELKPVVSVVSEKKLEQKKGSIPTLTINPKYTFDSFVTGPTNEVAHAACKAVSLKPGESYNPLLIYGGVGLGKTHLIQAIGNALTQNNPDITVLYVSSEKFINDFVNGIRERDTQAFKDTYRNVDVLMIDDIQFLAGKRKTQEELFHTFNALYSQNKQIILSSDRSPKAIPTLEERLRSRLTGGMMVDVQQPDYETRLAILETKAEKMNISIDQEAKEFIAKNIQKNVRELEGALNRVVAHCELNNQKATLPYTQKVLSSILDRPQQRTVDSKKIIDAVSVYYNLSIDDLCGKSRKQNIVRPRQIAMHLLRNENSSSFPSIGDLFGGRDHTTAMHACEKIDKLLEHDETLAQDIGFIKEKLYA